MRMALLLALLLALVIPAGLVLPVKAAVETPVGETKAPVLAVSLAHAGREPSRANLVLESPGTSFAVLRSGEQATLGVHAFTARSGDWIYGILRLSNGLVSPAGTGSCGTVYAEGITVTLDGGAVHLELPVHGPGSILFRPRGTLQIPFWARVPGPADDAGLQVQQPPAELLARLHGRIQPVLGELGYGPTNSRQPPVNAALMSARYSKYLAELTRVREGKSALYSNSAENIAFEYRLAGPYALEGYPDGYAHGGYGIDPSHGWEFVPESVEYHAHLHRANMHRQFCDAIDPATGEPISLYAWTKPPGRDLMKGQAGRRSEVELLCFLEGDYESRRYPSWNAPAIKPDGEELLWSYRPNDLAHIIRVLRHTIPLIEYAGDSPLALCARFDLRMLAENARYQQWSDRGDELVKPSYPGEWVPQSLSRVLQDPPGNGHPRLDRQAAWMAYLGACCLKYGGRRGDWLGWSRHMLEAILMHQDKLGLSHCDEVPAGIFPPGGRGTQTFHSALLGIATYALWLQVGDSAQWPEKIENMARAMYTTHEPLPYGSGPERGPAHWGCTQIDGRKLDAILWYGEGDPAHVLMFMGLMARGPRRDFWIDRSLKYWIPHASREQRLQWLRSRLERSWSAEMQAIMELESR